jgi:hypothetical protein
MSALLPLFPLQLVAFPGEQLNLHIFEPRYKQLVKDCEEQNITFGIPAFIDGRIQEYGTELELVKVEKRYTDGQLDIRTEGIAIFLVEEFFSRAPGKLYSGANIKRFPLELNGDIILSQKIIEKIELLYQTMRIDKPIPFAAEFTTFSVAHHVGFSIQQEYELLRIASEQDRQEYMLQHLNQLVPVVQEMEELRKRVQMNGHFKNIIPPNV